MRFALCQTNSLVGNLDHNSREILDAARTAGEQGADVALFPEMAMMGYPPRDLIDRPHFIEATQRRCEQLAGELKGCGVHTVIFGSLHTVDVHAGVPVRNTAVVVQDGRILGYADKMLLPNYDVFDESRYFQPAEGPTLIDLGPAGAKETVRIGISVCEDIWNDGQLNPHPRYLVDPIEAMVKGGAQIILNLSSSPFERNKQAYRRTLVRHAAGRHGVPVLYVNAFGATDDIIFDGGSMAADAQGSLLIELPPFQRKIATVEITPAIAPASAAHRAAWKVPAAAPTTLEAQDDGVLDALILGTKEYFRKSGFTRAILGLSGGIDSALVASLAMLALGKENVAGYSMPSRYSSDHSKEDAAILAGNLGIGFDSLHIEKAFPALLETLAPVFANRPPDVAEENMQARIRGLILMAISNKNNALLLTTGNKSEVAMGYCTLYGDMNGALNPIGDIYKTEVYRICRRVNLRLGRTVIPERSFTKAPSAELRPNQTDQDTLPPYDLLDEILFRYVDQKLGVDEIARQGYDPALVRKIARSVERCEYKRRQSAIILKVSPKAFGFGRRMVVAKSDFA
ncbi:MAG TPA: NAD+ synthase [Planctomycetota bacterium]|nr:NAD+ synthase [Planctomycetota bacterium]